MSRRGRREDGGASSRARQALGVLVAVVAAVALLLSMSLAAVSCGGDASGPEATVQEFLTAMGNQDIGAIVELTTSPEDLAALEEMGMSKEDLEYGADAEMLRSLGNMEFSDVTMKTLEDGEEATVTITGGTVTLERMGVTMDLTSLEDSGFPTEFSLYKVGGKWYIDMEE